MLKRKSQVEIQFNWIFILIAGAIILSFFVVIATRQKTASETQTNIGFFVNFEKALSGISASQGKTLLFEIPKLDLRYDCTTSCDCATYTGTSRAKAQFLFPMNDKIIFSPNSLKGNNLLTVSKDWQYPFRIINFIYMTSPEVKYLIEDTIQGNKIYEDLPPSTIEVEQKEQRAIDKALFTISEPVTGITGNYKVKFIFTDNDPEAFSIPSSITSLPDTDVTAIKVERSASADQPDQVVFYEKSNNKFVKQGKGTSYLFGDATVLASVFSEDLNSYDCMMNRAFKSLNMVSRVYKEKQSIFSSNEALTSQGCGIHYVDLATNSLFEDTSSFDFKNPDPAKASSIVTSTRTISVQNENAIKDSCPNIY